MTETQAKKLALQTLEDLVHPQYPPEVRLEAAKELLARADFGGVGSGFDQAGSGNKQVISG